MREKYLVLKERTIIGVVYNYKEGSIRMGGPRIFFPEMANIICETIYKGRRTPDLYCQNRQRVHIDIPCTPIQWTHLLAFLQEEGYESRPVRRFRRLMS